MIILFYLIVRLIYTYMCGKIYIKIIEMMFLIKNIDIHLISIY